MFPIPFNLLAEMTLGEKMLDAITVTIVGMGIVVVSLLVMGELFKLLGDWLIKPVPAEEPKPPAIPANQSDRIDPHLIVVLSAAAAAAVGKNVVLRRITFINHNTVSGWSEAGRLSIQSSHNIRRNM